MLEKICPPALLYLAFSMIQITIDLFQGEYETSLLKFIIMLIFAAVLNILCLNGFTKIVWFIVIIPILMLTYISSILFYVFGINPGKSTVRVKPQQQQQQPQQQQPQPQPQPQQPPPPRK
jgi:glucan phosphoethanolaminetransferase (alkaline phosphatase superfamily)